MKIMKFGGTSVGKPERMHQVSELITKDDETKIVVLSALSGTTNALVGIGESIANGNREKAKQQIDALEEHYQSFIKQLVKKDETPRRKVDIPAEHNRYLTDIPHVRRSPSKNQSLSLFKLTLLSILFTNPCNTLPGPTSINLVAPSLIMACTLCVHRTAPVS